MPDFRHSLTEGGLTSQRRATSAVPPNLSISADGSIDKPIVGLPNARSQGMPNIFGVRLPYMASWGDRIRERRMSLGWSMASLAKRVGVSAPTINDWEKGVIKNIEGANLLKVASVLGVTATFLLTGKKLTKDGELVPQISDNDGLGELSQEELDLIHAWRSWTDDTRNVVRSIMQHTGLQGHPLLEVAKKANPDDQLRANRALEQAQAKLRAKMPSPRAADKRKT